MSDALERLKNRKKPQVTTRDSSIESHPSDTIEIDQDESQANLSTITSTLTDTFNSGYLDIENLELDKIRDDQQHSDLSIHEKQNHTAQVKISTHLDTLKSTTPDVQISETPDMPTKQTTIRLEVNLSSRLTHLANNTGLCREAIIESMFEYMETHGEAQEIILQEAQEKNSMRQQIANYKRAKSMMKKFM
jgi:predicted DNA-binding protein